MQDEKIWRVSDVNAAIREIVENSLMPFWLVAEVGTLSIQRSGHVYLTFKDEKSQLRAVFFGGAAQCEAMNLRIGAAVEVYGKLTVYEVRGEYQFSIKMMRPVGMGELQRRFEMLKAKLEAEGLFDPAGKKPIPMLPGRIGVVTSPEGAAVRDFLQIINRRFPNIHIKIYPSPVQGKGAEVKLAAGIEFFNRHKCVDVIVITRGGGSLEDLWPFNEEILARAVAASRIPVISAVGHEIDFTICDFAADLRVPTPSAAAELVIGRRDELQARLKRARKDMSGTLLMMIQKLKSRFNDAAQSYVFREPANLLRQKQQLLDELTRNMTVAVERRQAKAGSDFSILQNRLKSAAPFALIKAERMATDRLVQSIKHAASFISERLRNRLSEASSRLNNVNPRNVLKRGYAILTDPGTGKPVKDPELPQGARLKAVIAAGTLDLTVEHGERNNPLS
ncbi:MAG: exodeoxyribonuclease VII large subunit [Lentisphaerota bacterium]